MATGVSGALPCAISASLQRRDPESEHEFLERYSARTGLDTSAFGFYLIYGYFRLAVILQQIYYRYYHGQTRDRRFAGFGHAVNALGGHARRLIERA